MDEFPFSALFLFAQSCLTDAVNVIFSDYCFTDTYLTGADVFLLVRDQPFSFSVKSFMTSEILICWGHTASQLRQPMQAEGFFSSGQAARAMGAIKPPSVKLCSL